MRSKLILTGVALMALTTFASAQNQGKGQRLQNGTGKGPAYVDTNKNDICDNYEKNTACFSQHRRNGTAYRGARGQRIGQGSGQNQGRGRGKGRNFVDVDKNGVCDSFEAATRK